MTLEIVSVLENCILVLTVLMMIVALIVGYKKFGENNNESERFCQYCNSKAVSTIKVCEKHEPR